MSCWATPCVTKLQAGETVQFRPKGNSMAGRIESGQLVTVEPITDPSLIEVDDAVLCKVKGTYYLHLVKAIDKGRYMIGNAKGFTNGWASANNVYGKVTKVEP